MSDNKYHIRPKIVSLTCGGTFLKYGWHSANGFGRKGEP